MNRASRQPASSGARSGSQKIRLRPSTALPLILTIASFGIYVSDFGVKLEHLLIYPLLVYALIVHATRKTWLSVVRPFFALVCLWGLLVFWFYSVTWTAAGFSDLRSVVKTTDNFVIPAAIILIITACLRKATEQTVFSTLMRVCNLLSILLAINGLLALMHSFWDISFLFQSFLPARDVVRGTNVWDRSLQMGRYLGVFSMPFEGGITYGLGVMTWLYARRRTGTVSVVQEVAFWLMIVGGVLTVSKAFIFAMLVCLCFALIELKHLRPVFNWRLTATTFVFTAGYVKFLDRWRGARFWLRLFALEDADLVDLFSAGRYVTGSGVLRRVGEVWAQAPLTGLGLGNPTTVDNAYLEVFWLGGLVGVAAYVLIILLLVRPGLASFGWNVEARFLTVLTGYAVAAGLGAPVLTMNKFATVFWTLVSLLLLVIDFSRRARCRVSAVSNGGIKPLSEV